MSKYLITFEKTGYIRYTSHLDMMRLFKRIIRKCGIKIAYSQGFNPHPKMSFALPLSLGYTGTHELLEIETEGGHNDGDTERIAQAINSAMPEGIKIIAVGHLGDRVENKRNRTVASAVYAGEYIIEVPLGCSSCSNIDGYAKRFIEQPSIIVEKVQKKTGKILETDIKPLINSLSADINADKLIISANIAQGSEKTLSPELLLSTFYKFINLEFDRSEVEMTRTKILYDAERI